MPAPRTRTVCALVVVGALLTAVLVVAARLSGHDAHPETGTTAASKRHSTRCHGITHRQVRGLDPTYTRKRLAEFGNHRFVCHGVWLPEPRRWFVPQGLAISRNTAWISGFRWRPAFGQRNCQLMRVDLVTGRRLAFHTSIFGRVGSGGRTYCRHGGGLLQRGPWLWIAEKGKLWLVDPRSRHHSLTAARVWRIHAPIRGSAIVSTRTRIGLVPYATRGRPRAYWFSMRSVLRSGVTDLGVRRDGRHQAGAVSSLRVPRLTQGATVDSAGRLYLTRSNLSCSELVTPSGRRVGFVPGAEGLAFAAHGRRLWAVSESGARPYAVSRKPLTPAVTSFEFPRLLTGRDARCAFPRY